MHADQHFFNYSIFDCIEGEKNLLKRKLKYKENTARVSKKIPRLWERYTEDAETTNILNSFDPNNSLGDKAVADLRTALSCYKTRTKQQVLFHEVFLQSNLPNLYGEEYEANELRIKQEHLIEEDHQFSLLCCPRRFGKTEAVAMFVSAYLYAKPGANIMLFSPSKRQSVMLMERIRERTFELRDKYGLEFSKSEPDNQEIFSIFRDGTRRQVMGLPAKEDTTRGTGGHLIICEEAAAMPMRFFLTVVVPVLQVVQTALIAISTVKDEDNYYTKLINLKNEDGTPFFHTFKFFMACEECREAGKQASCQHLLHTLPHWMSGAKLSKIKYIYEQLGKRILYILFMDPWFKKRYENGFN